MQRSQKESIEPKSDYFCIVKNRWLQWFLVGILALSQWIPIWESHCLNKQRHWIKEQIRTNLFAEISGKLETIFVLETEFSSLQKGDEIELGAHRYDIIRVKKVSKGWMAVVFNDEFEKQLLVRIADDFQKGGPSDLTKNSFLKLVFFMEALPLVQFHIPRETRNWIINDPFYLYQFSSDSFRPPESLQLT